VLKSVPGVNVEVGMPVPMVVRTLKVIADLERTGAAADQAKVRRCRLIPADALGVESA
jgi:hypothetical protein